MPCNTMSLVIYLLAALAGEPWTVKKAVCVHEEDAGICWKHTEYRNGHAEVRRNRRLVMSFIATGARYCGALSHHRYPSPYLDPCRDAANLLLNCALHRRVCGKRCQEPL